MSAHIQYTTAKKKKKKKNKPLGTANNIDDPCKYNEDSKKARCKRIYT